MVLSTQPSCALWASNQMVSQGPLSSPSSGSHRCQHILKSRHCLQDSPCKGHLSLLAFQVSQDPPKHTADIRGQGAEASHQAPCGLAKKMERETHRGREGALPGGAGDSQILTGGTFPPSSETRRGSMGGRSTPPCSLCPPTCPSRAAFYE